MHNNIKTKTKTKENYHREKSWQFCGGGRKQDRQGAI